MEMNVPSLGAFLKAQLSSLKRSPRIKKKKENALRKRNRHCVHDPMQFSERKENEKPAVQRSKRGAGDTEVMGVGSAHG